jgi:hypothetical protein
MKLVTGSATAPNSTLTALTMYTDDSAQILNPPNPGFIRLIKQWAKVRTAGNIRTRSPQMGSDVQGLRFRVPINNVEPPTPYGFYQEMQAQDVPTFEISGSATASDIEIFSSLFLYQGYSGGQFVTPDFVESFKKSIQVHEQTISTGTTGGYSGSSAMTNGTYNLKADTYYAMMGYTVDVICGAVRWKGPDFGNYGLGGPGVVSPKSLGNRFWYDLSLEYGIGLVPIVKFENLAQTFLDVAQDEDGTDVTVSTILVELDPAVKGLIDAYKTL